MVKVKTNGKECANLTDEDLAKVVAYFTPVPKWPWFFVALGLLIFFGDAWIVVGLGCLALGIYFLMENSKNRVSDDEFDAIQDKAYSLLGCVALDKLGLDAGDTVRENMLIKGPRYYDRSDADLVFKEGEDGIVRYSLHNIVIMVFTKKHLAMYQCALDLQTGNRLNERTEEFFYKDIVSVGTQTQTNTLLDEDSSFNYISGSSNKTISITQQNAWESFELRNAGGGVITVPIESKAVLKQMGGSFEESEIDKAVNSIRVVLRDKK